jgi:predicted phage tail protein
MLTTEEILDLLSTLILDLGAIREQMTDTIDRAALNNQIMALTKWWRKLDDIRASEPRDDLADAQKSLEDISKELKKEKKKLENVAKVIHKAAQAIAIAEKVVKLVA